MVGKRLALWSGEILGILGFLYCLLGAIQAAWLSATPNYPLERARFNFYLWGAGSLLFLLVVIMLGVLLYRTRN